MQTMNRLKHAAVWNLVTVLDAWGFMVMVDTPTPSELEMITMSGC